MIVGLHHVAISVPDMKKALAFYCGALGFEEVMSASVDGDSEIYDRIIGLRKISTEMRMVKAGNAYIELFEYRHPAPRSKDGAYPPSDHGIAHFCLQVKDIKSECARLTAAGMTFVGPPVDEHTWAAIYGRDPFGNIIEIYEVRDPAIPHVGSVA